LDIDFGINNERQECKIGAMCGGYLWKRRVNGGDESEEMR
jgi:hypothetical protein